MGKQCMFHFSTCRNTRRRSSFISRWAFRVFDRWMDASRRSTYDSRYSCCTEVGVPAAFQSKEEPSCLAATAVGNVSILIALCHVRALILRLCTWTDCANLLQK